MSPCPVGIDAPDVMSDPPPTVLSAVTGILAFQRRVAVGIYRVSSGLVQLNAVWRARENQLRKVQSVQNAATRLYSPIHMSRKKRLVIDDRHLGQPAMTGRFFLFTWLRDHITSLRCCVNYSGCCRSRDESS